MARYYTAILFVVSTFVSNASAQQPKDGLLRGNNSDEVAEQNFGNSGLGNRRLQSPTEVTFKMLAQSGGGVPKIRDICVNKDGSSGWGVGKGEFDGKTYEFECSDGNCSSSSFRWVSETNGEMSKLTAESISYSGNSNHVWAVANGFDLYRGFTVDQWMYRDQPDGVSFKQISVSFCGKHVYAVDDSSSPRVWYKEVVNEKTDGREPAWTLSMQNGAFDGYSDVAVDKEGNVFAIKNNSLEIWRYSFKDKKWNKNGTLSSDASKALTVSVARDIKDGVWVVDSDYQLWRSVGDGSSGNKVFKEINYKIEGGGDLKMGTISVSGDGKKLFAATSDSFGDTYMADIDTTTLAATV